VLDQLAEFFGESPAVVAVRDTLRRLLDRARAGQRLPPVLLQGDTGTGKGLVARLLHRVGPRRDAPFVDVNCAALPLPLLEAELFGFARGAFTDARHPKPGLFHAAHRGVLFLDEIALLPAPVQAKLLTAIEDRAVRRLGSTRAEPADVWVLSASNANLRSAVAERRFCDDLYHRLAVVTIELPPLRERGRDILLLAQRFLTRTCAEYSLPAKRLDADAETRLLAHSWPGNVRELSNVIERAALLADGLSITDEALRPLGSEIHKSDTSRLEWSLDPSASWERSADPDSRPATGRDDVLRRQLLDALQRTDWNISLAAAHLGVARNTVYARLEKFGLRRAPPRTVGDDHARRSDAAVLSHVSTLASSENASPGSDAALQWERRSLALFDSPARNVGDSGSGAQ